jgi:hypothetical protein
VLYPLFVLLLDAGLRPSESRVLRRVDLALQWVDGTIVYVKVIVAKSKTKGGMGRVMELTNRAGCALLRLLDAGPNSHVSLSIGLALPKRSKN